MKVSGVVYCETSGEINRALAKIFFSFLVKEDLIRSCHKKVNLQSAGNGKRTCSSFSDLPASKYRSRPDSYPVAIYVFCGMRRLDTRMD